MDYALAVAEELHFRRAAERCHISQPALSTQVRLLEETLGVQLFERDRRGVLITPLGKEILERAAAIRRDVRELQHLAKRASRPLSGVLRLGVIPTVAPYVLPALIPPLRRRHSELELWLREEQSQELLKRLRAGELELALMALPVEGEDLGSEEILWEAFHLLLPENHELARRKSIHADDLVGQEFLLLEDGHCLRDQALEYCDHRGLDTDEKIRASSLSTLVQMVGAGLGLTFIPASALARELPATPGAVARPLEDLKAGRTLGLVWREGSARAWEFRLLADSLREIMATQPALP